MKPRLGSGGLRVTAALGDFIRQRLRYALGGFQHMVDHAVVRLRDDNRPRGGVDELVRVRGGRPVLIEERARDRQAAIGRGSRCGERQVIRSLELRRTGWRS